MDEKPRKVRHWWWWFGVYVLLAVILLYGPIWTCPTCEGKGETRIVTPTPPTEYEWVQYRCRNCYSLGRVGLVRKFSAP